MKNRQEQTIFGETRRNCGVGYGVSLFFTVFPGRNPH